MQADDLVVPCVQRKQRQGCRGRRRGTILSGRPSCCPRWSSSSTCGAWCACVGMQLHDETSFKVQQRCPYILPSSGGTHVLSSWTNVRSHIVRRPVILAASTPAGMSAPACGCTPGQRPADDRQWQDLGPNCGPIRQPPHGCCVGGEGAAAASSCFRLCYSHI